VNVGDVLCKEQASEVRAPGNYQKYSGNSAPMQWCSPVRRDPPQNNRDPDQRKGRDVEDARGEWRPSKKVKDSRKGSQDRTQMCGQIHSEMIPQIRE
jgi:hypothetical protein